jgi:hypothetical protein
MLEARTDPLKLPENERKKILGFLTAIAWFSRDSARCVRRLWSKLQTCAASDLPLFFNRARFKLLIPFDKRMGPILLPIVPPDILESVIRNRVTNGTGSYGGFTQIKHKFWAPGNWVHYGGWLVNDNFANLNGALKKWLRKLSGAENSENEQDRDEVLRSAWGEFLDRLWNERRLLQYVQRDWLLEWFSDYDPTLPDQIEDVNQPWDYDHIHPRSLVQGKWRVPSVVRDWHSSIGNLRIWPLELNRSDQDDLPCRKLAEIGEAEGRYKINSIMDLRKASLIGECNWEFWNNSVAGTNGRYLAQPNDLGDHTCRMNFIRAVTGRFIDIYAEWYNRLLIGELNPTAR